MKNPEFVYRESPLRKVVAYARTPVLPSRLVVALFELLLCGSAWMFGYARIRSQPPERIVRVNVPVPGPVRILSVPVAVPGPERIVRVEVPALPPPQCVDSASTLRLAYDTPMQSCPFGSVAHVVPGDENFVVLECHCPRTP